MKEKYFLNERSLPNLPTPHDGVIKEILLKDQSIIFVFEDFVPSYHEFVNYYAPGARSLIIKYHLVYDEGDYSIYKWRKPVRPFSKEGYYKQLNNGKLVALPHGKIKLEYITEYVGYFSVITELYSNGSIILKAYADYVEYDWIF